MLPEVVKVAVVILDAVVVPFPYELLAYMLNEYVVSGDKLPTVTT
jgi:hypothetical protein